MSDEENWHPPLSTALQILQHNNRGLPRWRNKIKPEEFPFAYWHQLQLTRLRQVHFLMANIDTLLVDPSVNPNTEVFRLDPTNNQSVVGQHKDYL